MIELRIIFPASKADELSLEKGLKEIENMGFPFAFTPLNPDPSLPFVAASKKDRLAELTSALLDPSPLAILCGRGGYGSSDLLADLPWKKLKKSPQKWLIGYSDISALQSALYSKLGWPSIHGPMPANSYWGENGRLDIEKLIQLLQNLQQQSGTWKIQQVSKTKTTPIEGRLFGGCLSVLCNLIGTPFFPKSLQGTILFLEDIGENPGRILRMINQLILSGLLKKCSAVILGPLGINEEVQSEIARRLTIPVFKSGDFGHISPNIPIVIGSRGSIIDDQLNWSYGD